MTWEAFRYWIDQEMLRQGWHFCREMGNLHVFLQMPAGQVLTEIEFGVPNAAFGIRQRPGTVPCR